LSEPFPDEVPEATVQQDRQNGTHNIADGARPRSSSIDPTKASRQLARLVFESDLHAGNTTADDIIIGKDSQET
jgi:hypothetical protein